MMNTSNSGLAFRAQREACVLTTYPDGVGFSQGFGIFNATPGETKTFEECIELFRKQASVTDNDMDAVFGGVPFTQVQYDALGDVVYNIGRTQLLKETELRMAVETFSGGPDERVRQDNVAVAFLKVKYKIGKYHNLARRMSDGTLFLRGDYGDLTYLKLWTEYKVPGVDKPLLVKMPVFR